MLLSQGGPSVFPFGKMRFTECEIPPLQNLVSRADFDLWRGKHAMHNSYHDLGPDVGVTSHGRGRLPKSIRRASSARSGFSSSRCAMQFSTASPDKILSAQVVMDPVAPRGEGA